MLIAKGCWNQNLYKGKSKILERVEKAREKREIEGETGEPKRLGSCFTNIGAAFSKYVNCSTYLSSDALSSKTASLKFGPRSSCARANILVVLPVPGGP